MAEDASPVGLLGGTSLEVPQNLRGCRTEREKTVEDGTGGVFRTAVLSSDTNTASGSG